jgi:hypothetical protein
MTKVASPEASKNTLYCSFCGKSQHEVKKLIAGPTTFICDECVELCNGILVAEGTPAGKLFLNAFTACSPTACLEQASYPSVGALLREGGLLKKKGPYNAFEVFTAIMNVLNIRLERLPADIVEKEAAAKALRQKIKDRIRKLNQNAEEELRPMEEELASLESFLGRKT